MQIRQKHGRQKPPEKWAKKVQKPKNQDCATDPMEFLLVRGALKGINKDGITTTNYSTIGRHLASCQESGLPLSYDPEILREYFDKLPGLQFQRLLGWVGGGDFSDRFDHGCQCLFMDLVERSCFAKSFNFNGRFYMLVCHMFDCFLSPDPFWGHDPI